MLENILQKRRSFYSKKYLLDDFTSFLPSYRGRGRKPPGMNHIKPDSQEAKPSSTYIHKIVPTVGAGVASSSLSVDPVLQILNKQSD